MAQAYRTAAQRACELFQEPARVACDAATLLGAARPEAGRHDGLSTDDGALAGLPVSWFFFCRAAGRDGMPYHMAGGGNPGQLSLRAVVPNS